MTKKKSIITKLFVALVALTLISCCFLGSTFARYTSGGNGSATTNIALWDVSLTGAGSSGAFDVSLAEKLTPSVDDYSDAKDRTNTTGKVLVATIKYNIEVAGKLTITASDLSPVFNRGNNQAGTAYATQLGSGMSLSEGAVTGTPSQDQFNKVFELKLYTGTDQGGTGSQDYTSGSEITMTVGSAQTLYVFAEVTWTSLDTDATLSGTSETLADAIDTWFGENLASLSTTLTYKAVQSAQIPAASGD